MNYDHMIDILAKAVWCACQNMPDLLKYGAEHDDCSVHMDPSGDECRVIAKAALEALQNELPEYNMIDDGTKKPALTYYYLRILGRDDV